MPDVESYVNSSFGPPRQMPLTPTQQAFLASSAVRAAADLDRTAVQVRAVFERAPMSEGQDRFDLVEVKAYLVEVKRGRVAAPERYPADFDWAVSVLEDAIGEVERLRAALAQADNTISAVRRGAQQARNEIHVALGWDHGGVALIEDP